MNMLWNWQQEGWPLFNYTVPEALEREFLLNSGILLGAYKAIKNDEKDTLIIDIISDEALKTSEIEGEYLNRDSLQSSIRRNLGLETPKRRIKPAEQGISEIMVDLYQNFKEPLTHELLFKWHSMVMKGRVDLDDIGNYRTHEDKMQVISGPIHQPIVHFEAPPSNQILKEMDIFVKWFNSSINLPALTRASITHLYFLCIHPFEDGNGRIGRALVVKALAQSLGHRVMITLSQTIETDKKTYYSALESNNKAMDINAWVTYFASVILKAQKHTTAMVEFLIKKAKFYEAMKNQLNERQSKVIDRVFREGVKGFEGGLSAENYISITSTSRATATRDLTDLVAKKALIKMGIGKGTRYQLNIYSIE